VRPRKRSAFGAGFGGALGAIIAIIVFFAAAFGGCIYVVKGACNSAAKKIRKETVVRSNADELVAERREATASQNRSRAGDTTRKPKPRWLRYPDMIRDAKFGLTWERGLRGMTWEVGVKHCRELHAGGDDDWRLPTAGELRTLAGDGAPCRSVYGKNGKATVPVNAVAFKGLRLPVRVNYCSIPPFWTSDPNPASIAYRSGHWAMEYDMNFDRVSGGKRACEKHYRLLVRCVRGTKRKPDQNSVYQERAQDVTTSRANAKNAESENRRPKKATTRPVEFLHGFSAVVAVSSALRRRDALVAPKHLVDGDLGTAWNSKPGDLTGAWIAFRLSRSVSVRELRMTAGFTRRHARYGDLFVKNHRITRVRLMRIGMRGASTLQTFDLDPDDRGMQKLILGRPAPGGDFRVEVMGTVAGSNPKWRELCVTEFQVWGELPVHVVSDGSRPVVRVGSLDSASEKMLASKKNPSRTTRGRASKKDRPGILTRAMVQRGIGRVRRAVQACTRHKEDSAPATVMATISVAPNGSVQDVKASVDGRLAECVAAVLRRARFESTMRGRTFAYPFLFR